MKLKSLHIALITLVLVFGGIMLSSALGYWSAEDEKVPAKFKDAELSGQYDPESIKGSFSFGDISEYFEIPLDDLAKAFGLTDPSAYSAFKCKELESIYTFPDDSDIEIGTGSVKVFVALYKNLPIDLSTEDSFLTTDAAKILKAEAILSEERLSYLTAHTIDITDKILTPSASDTTGVSAEKPAASSASAAKTTEENPYAVKGTTTFKDLLNWNLTEAEIEGVIKSDMPFTGTKIRDYAEANQLEYSTIKAALEEIIKRKNP